MKSHGDQIRRFMTALQQGIQREKSDEAYSTKLLAEHLQVNDAASLHETWEYYAKEVLPGRAHPHRRAAADLRRPSWPPPTRP